MIGFGGNGLWVFSDFILWMLFVLGCIGGGCVVDGFFVGINDLVYLGFGSFLVYNLQCLKRDFVFLFVLMYLGMNQIQFILSQFDFGWFNVVVEGFFSFDVLGVYGGGYFGVGGMFGQYFFLYGVFVVYCFNKIFRLNG